MSPPTTGNSRPQGFHATRRDRTTFHHASQFAGALDAAPSSGKTYWDRTKTRLTKGSNPAGAAAAWMTGLRGP